MAHGSAGLKAVTTTRGDVMARQRRTGREALMRRRRRRDWCGARRGAGDDDGDTSGVGLGAAQLTATVTARGELETARRWRRDMTRRCGARVGARQRRGRATAMATKRRAAVMVE
uniref:Uncharacterized protein n=1 Tax=Oryza meridionalis TaxID=40149 RepID=A0A0E0C355_9ORYZ